MYISFFLLYTILGIGYKLKWKVILKILEKILNKL